MLALWRHLWEGSFTAILEMRAKLVDQVMSLPEMPLDSSGPC